MPLLIVSAADWVDAAVAAIPRDEAWMLLRVFIAGLLGGVLGWEREVRGKEAGLRTHVLVALAAGLYAAVTVLLASPESTISDALRTINAVATGIGFLGAGLIFVNRSEGRVRGLTTAASVWATAAVGLTVGFGYWLLAGGATAMIWSVLRLLSALERDHPDGEIPTRRNVRKR